MIGIAAFVLLATWVLGVASAIAAKPWFMARVGLVITTPIVIVIMVLYLMAWLEVSRLSLG